MIAYTIWNEHDNIMASPDIFKSIEAVQEYCKQYRDRYRKQGYYRDNRWNKIPPDEIQLDIREIEIDANEPDIEFYEDRQ